MTGSECADNYFCAYHANVVQNGADVIDAAIPLVKTRSRPARSMGTRGFRTNGIPADVALDNRQP